jgi:hypothetical protein
MVTNAEVVVLAEHRQINIINLDERVVFRGRHYDHPNVNIPLDELKYRAAEELDRGRVQVVDCSLIGEAVCASVLSLTSQVVRF